MVHSEEWAGPCGRVAIEGVTSDDRELFSGELPPGVSVLRPGETESADDVRCLVLSGQPDDHLLERFTGLRTLVRMGPSGSIDDQFRTAGIQVIELSSVVLDSVAEHTVMLMMMLWKRVLDGIRMLREGVVESDLAPALTTQHSYAFNWVGLGGFEAVRGQRVGLVGLGSIGRAVASRLRALGADVVYTKRHRLLKEEERELGVRFESFEDLLASCSCVSLHARFNGDNEMMMGAREFAMMPHASIFINTSRGRLVDEAALLRALKSGHLRGAALDVFWYEPLPRDSPLLSAPNLILTPHVGGIPHTEGRAFELREAARTAATWA